MITATHKGHTYRFANGAITMSGNHAVTTFGDETVHYPDGTVETGPFFFYKDRDAARAGKVSNNDDIPEIPNMFEKWVEIGCPLPREINLVDVQRPELERLAALVEKHKIDMVEDRQKGLAKLLLVLP